MLYEEGIETRRKEVQGGRRDEKGERNDDEEGARKRMKQDRGDQ